MTTAIAVIVPLTLWTFICVYTIQKNVPSTALKTSAILIFFGPLLLMICNLASISVTSDQTLALIFLFEKLYIMVLLYSFYFMIREVVFYEHLLQ